MKDDSRQTIRSFVAVELSDEAKDVLVRLQSRLKEVIPPKTLRWTPPKNIHLTLHFLGDVSRDVLEPATLALQDVATRISPFSLQLSNLGCFPNTRRPRIVWVGLSGDMQILVRLHKELGIQLQKGIGFQPESRPFKPHLTIGRVKKGIASHQLHTLGQLIDQQIPMIGHLVDLPVEEVHFIRSDLKPDGPIYTRLAHGILKG